MYFFLDCGFAQIFGQIISIKVMLHEPKLDSISVQVGGCSRTKHNTRLFRTIPIHLKSGIFVCRDRLLLLSRYLISFSRKCLLVLDRGISNEEVSTRAVIKIRGAVDFPRLLRTWPLATFIGKQKKNRKSKAPRSELMDELN